jgi:uncharacterized protein (DUF305 family)
MFFKNKIMIKILICVLLSTAAFAQHDMHQMDAMHHDISKNIFLLQMDTMMINMDTVKQTNVAETDFLKLMIPHHQGAVEMALYEVAHGSNKEMIQLAKSIIAEQQTEIQMMKHLLSSSCNSVPNEITAEWNATMSTMMNNMPPSAGLANIDVAFAKVMMAHHQAGIDMAKVLLKYGIDKAVRRMAESIISSQQIEIGQIKNYIK